MARNYDLDWDDWDRIDNHWDYDTAQKYSVDLNGVWYKNEQDEDE